MFVNERPVKATRKLATCAACGTHIQIGEPAIRWAGITDGEFSSAAYHPDCREAEIRMNRECGSAAYDWFALSERDPDDDDWIAVNFPAVAERLGITTTKGEG